ncbi:MAG: hypothetical protein HY433_00995 [Candidatus Liptonbacteria bacterium]|nr:hypothetical protein [Candidatus Liptonbacteria bacterium]
MFSKKFFYIILGILFVGSLGMSLYYYRQYKALYQTSPQSAQDEAKKLVAEVGRLIILPADEQPTVATVDDPEQLKDQLFFANAKKGDKVLIYTNAKKAILYNPTEGKIVEVAPVSIGQPPSQGSGSPRSSSGEAGEQAAKADTAQSSSTASSTPKKK